MRIEISDFVMRTYVHEEVGVWNKLKRMRLLVTSMGGVSARSGDVCGDGARVREAWAVVLDWWRRARFSSFVRTGKRGVLCEHIAEELQETVDRVGDLIVFEITAGSSG